MGLPRNFFSLLSDLRRSTTNEGGAAQRCLGEFSLFAVILDDPSKPQLKEVLEERYDFLDRATKKHLLFFAPIDEPEGWREAARERGHSCRELFQTYGEKIEVEEPKFGQLALNNVMAVDEAQLPALLVTPDLKANDFWLVPTSPNTVLADLFYLAEIAESIRPLGHRSTPVTSTDVERVVAAEFPGELRSANENTLDRLFLTLASTLREVHNPILRRRAQRVFETGLERRWNKIMVRRTEVENEQPQNLFESAARVPMYDVLPEDLLHQFDAFSALIAAGQVEPLEISPLHGKWMPRSMMWIETGDRVMDFLDSGPLPHLDWSPPVVSWSKAFEWEIALSPGHLIRRDLGIELPSYFAKYQPETKAKCGSVDFNSHVVPGMGWKPPSLGKMGFVFKEYCERLKVPENTLEQLLDIWNRIRIPRNDACHPGNISREQARTVRETLKEMEDSGVADWLFSTRDRLRGK